MKTETRKFDPTNYIGSPQMQAEYLRAALEDGDPDTIAIVLGDIARARGASEFAKDLLPRYHRRKKASIDIIDNIFT